MSGSGGRSPRISQDSSGAPSRTGSRRDARRRDARGHARAGARPSSEARRSIVSRNPFSTIGHHAGTPSSGSSARQLDVDDHLGPRGVPGQDDRHLRALVEAVRVELGPPVGCAPRIDEALVRDDLAIDPAGEVRGVLVDHHQLPPDPADAQVELDRIRRRRLPRRCSTNRADPDRSRTGRPSRATRRASRSA